MPSKGRLLLVGAGDMPLMLLGHFLEDLGYKIAYASDTTSALGVLASDKVEVIVNQLLGTADPLIVAALQDAAVKQPVLVLTPEGEIAKARDAGAAEAIPWPSPRPDVADAVERVLQGYRATKISSSVESVGGIIDEEAWAKSRDPSTQRIGRYRVEERIGRGAMGEVFRCRDEVMGRLVAVKTMHLELGLKGESKAFAERFMVEAGSLARLVHPGIVATYDFGMDQRKGEMFLVMEYVDGPNLRYRTCEGKMPIADALRIGWDLADALSHAHGRGVIHRDIKPGNVLLDGLGKPKLTDFGLARLGNFSVSQGMMVVGSPSYIAPEQILKPSSIDHRADQYSLGVVLYEMLTGWEAKLSGNIQEQVLSGMNLRRPSLEELEVDAPAELQQMLSCMMAKMPNNRFLDDEDMLDAFVEIGQKLGLNLERAM